MAAGPGEAVEWLPAALSCLHSGDATTPAEQRRAAEAALLQFQQSEAAWTTCLRLLSQQKTAAANVLLFAAQTLRTKINEQGSSLSPPHLDQLKHTVLQQLLQPRLPTALLRQLCLALASLAALLPAWQGWLQPVGSSLPWRNAVQLLHDVAEEGSSDWRHVTVPGLTSSEKLSWATTTRDRFRSWSPEALQLLHCWLQQQQPQQPQQPQQQATVRLLECLTAWVKLGCLHHVSQQQAEATAHVGLQAIQSSQAEVVTAALGLLTELPEFATEQLIRTLQPHMLQMAAAAVAAASATQQPAATQHVAAWTAAFSAYAAAVPSKLLAAAAEDGDAPAAAAGGDEGQGGSDQLRHALLQVSGLPHIHNAQLVCLPALQVWSFVLGHESPASAARFTAAGGGSGSLSRASTVADAAEAAAAADVAAADVAAALAAVTGDEAVTGGDRPDLPSCVVQACQQLLLQTACSCLLWAQSAEGWEAAGTLEASAAVHDLFLAVCCVLGQQQYLQHILHVWGQQPQQQQQQPQELSLGRPALQQVLQCIAAAPPALRLHVAVEMAAAAAAVVQPGDGDTAAAVSSHADMQQVCTSIADLLSAAAAQVQSATGYASCLHAHFTLCFCQAVQVWASYLAAHFVDGPEEQGSAAMGSLMQLLVGIASQQQLEEHSLTRSAAAAAVRALTSAALHLGWDQLYRGTPLLLQAVQHLSGVDSADQDLFASLAMCLAAVGAPQQELQELRAASCQQLVQPAIDHVGTLLQQLQGSQWPAAAIGGKATDVQLCQHMVGVRVVLEAAWQRLLHQQGARGGSSSGAAAAATDFLADLGSTTAGAAFEMEEDVLLAAAAQPHAAQDQHLEDDFDPAVQLVVSQLWSQLHVLVVQHGAAGKCLQHYAKCCSKLLKLRPQLLLKQQQLVQFLEVAVLGLVRPGGCGLGEPLLTAVELCCQQQGPELLLGAGPCMNQAYAQLWALPEVLSLQQPGHGDAQPDLSECILKLSAAWARHSSVLQPSTSQLTAVLPGIIAAAAACARCCHKKVGTCALAALVAVLTTAAAEDCGSQQFQEIVTGHAVLIASGVLGGLLVPSPLPRLQKVSSALLELAALAAVVDHTLPDQPRAGAGTVFGTPTRSHLGHLHQWLLQATQGFVPAPLSAGEAADFAAACAGLLVATPPTGQPADVDGGSGSRQVPASRSYVAARRLKKRLRDFAEKHMRRTQPG